MNHFAEQSSAGESTGCGGTPRMLHETEQWMVLHKPAGWHSVEARVSSGGAVLSRWITEHHPSQSPLADAGLVHRLDQCTSGCMIAAKNESMHRELRDAVSGRGGISVVKVYLALVKQGVAAQGRFELLFSSRHKGSAKMTVRRDGEGERGECAWRVVRAAEALKGEKPDSSATTAAFDLVEVQLLGPGRRHQIRAGMAFIGHPLAGDSLYRGTPFSPPGSAGCFALHAWRVVIDGVSVEDPPPYWAQH